METQAVSGSHVCTKIAIGICGSSGAASMIPEFLMLCKRYVAAEVTVVMTPAAQRFISPYVVGLYAKSHPITDLYEAREGLVSHIEPTQGAELFVIVPATANTLAKLAIGIADSPVTTVALAASCPVVVVPSMNGVMWQRKIVQDHLESLKLSGFYVIPPVVGLALSDYQLTTGCMPDNRSVIKALIEIICKQRAVDSSP